MKVFILALDALEYNLVTKWDMENLKQTTYGKFKLSPEYFHEEENVPYTPIVWASFITGKKPSEHRIKSIFTYGKLLEKLRWFKPIKAIKGKRKILWKLGIKPRTVNRGDLNLSTIFDKVKPSIAFQVPTYNESTELNLILRVFLQEKSIKEFIQKTWEIFHLKRRQLFEILDKQKDWKLFMAYFKVADLLGHVYLKKNPKKLKEVYFILDTLTEEIKEKMPNNILFLIVSDHGMQIGDDPVFASHSNHAFWSLNIKTNWKPKDITDFYPKIIEWTKAETTKQFQVK